MTPPTTDTSREAMLREAEMMDASSNHVWAEKTRALVAERDTLRDQLAAARNEALEEAKALADAGHKYHSDARVVQVALGNDDAAQDRMASMTTCAVLSADIDALKSTTNAAREVTVQEDGK